jgi:hypothetical protein
LAVKEARAVWLDTPDLAENGASTAGCQRHLNSDPLAARFAAGRQRGREFQRDIR